MDSPTVSNAIERFKIGPGGGLHGPADPVPLSDLAGSGMRRPARSWNMTRRIRPIRASASRLDRGHHGIAQARDLRGKIIATGRGGRRIGAKSWGRRCRRWARHDRHHGRRVRFRALHAMGMKVWREHVVVSHGY